VRFIFTRIDRHNAQPVNNAPVLDLDDLGPYLGIKLLKIGKNLIALCAIIFTQIDRHNIIVVERIPICGYASPDMYIQLK